MALESIYCHASGSTCFEFPAGYLKRPFDSIGTLNHKGPGVFIKPFNGPIVCLKTVLADLSNVHSGSNKDDPRRVH